jgi:hypothetical protein
LLPSIITRGALFFCLLVLPLAFGIRFIGAVVALNFFPPTFEPHRPGLFELRPWS